MKSFRPTRRTFLKTGTAAAALIGFGPAVLRQAAAQEADLAPYKAAKIDWQQASGETITVAVIPASYFDNLITLAPQFEALTGIDGALREDSAGADPAEERASTSPRRPAPTPPMPPTRCTTRCMPRTNGSSRSTATSPTNR